jgi:hypothetical protein
LAVGGQVYYDGGEAFMKIRYDPESDALDIIFREATVMTKHLAADMIVE